MFLLLNCNTIISWSGESGRVVALGIGSKSPSACISALDPRDVMLPCVPCLRGWCRCLTLTPPCNSNPRLSRQIHSDGKVQRNFYDSLGLTPKASHGDIKQAYYTLSLKYHPDKSEGESEKFREITAAYEILGNFKLRRLYDRGALHPEHAPSPSETASESVHTANFEGFEGRERVPMTGRTVHFNFDDWSKAHYGRIFEREEGKRRKLAARRRMENLNGANHWGPGSVVLVLLFIITTLGCSLMPVTSSQYDDPKKNGNDKNR